MPEVCPNPENAPCDTVRELGQDFRRHQDCVTGKLDGISEQLQSITGLLVQFTELSGKHDRLGDAVHRIGKQLDKLEERTRLLETTGAALLPQVKGNERVIWAIVAIVAGAGGYLVQ